MERAEKYEIVIVKYGTRTTVRSDVYLNYPIYAEPDAPIDMDYFVWVVRNENRTVLVDTGFSRPGGEARNRSTLLDLEEAYRGLGIDPAESPLVILTHAHYDHIGNLALFPGSSVIVSAAELAFWTGHEADHHQFQHSVEAAEIETLSRAVQEGRVTTISGSYTAAPGIELIEVGGHTPGQLVVKVQTSDGPALLASDAIHYYEEFERDMPFTYVADLVAMYNAFDRIRGMVDSGEVVHVVSGHDPGTLGRFAPAQGELAGLAATIGRLDG